MQIFHINSLDEELPLDYEVAVCIGNFDGLHRGHQALIKRCRTIANNLGIQTAALTFNPHPEEFFLRHGKSEELLFTLDQKIRAMKEMGVEILFVQSFHEQLAHLTAEQFLENYLRHKLHARAIIVGSNFRFGYQRQGDSEYLKQYCKRQKLIAETVDAETYRDEVISSTRIRKSLLHNGNTTEVRAMLSRPYLLEGFVGRGDQLGRKIGFPTANLTHVDQLIPANGVYAGWVWDPRDAKAGAANIMHSTPGLKLAVINIGQRPTVNHELNDLRVEVHIISDKFADDELYNKKLYVYLCERLRGEIKFENLEELRTEIRRNILQTKDLQPAISF